MKLRKLVLVCAIASPCVNAFEVCNIGDEYNVLDRESFHDIRKSNYRNFSEDLTPEDLFCLRQNTMLTLDLRLPKLTKFSQKRHHCLKPTCKCCRS